MSYSLFGKFIAGSHPLCKLHGEGRAYFAHRALIPAQSLDTRYLRECVHFLSSLTPALKRKSKRTVKGLVIENEFP
jgi:hypothetical protein